MSERDSTRTIRSMQSLAGRPGTDVVSRLRSWEHPRKLGCHLYDFGGPLRSVRNNLDVLRELLIRERHDRSLPETCSSARSGFTSAATCESATGMSVAMDLKQQAPVPLRGLVGGCDSPAYDAR
jgi:hypothetical protein